MAMNDTDKVTLEYTRLNGNTIPYMVSPSHTLSHDYLIKAYDGFVVHETGVGYWSESYDTAIVTRNFGAKIFVLVRVQNDRVDLFKPTIARFHEAVAFLGAKLPHLRPGEA